MRRVVAGNDINRAIRETGEQRLPVRLGAHRRIHFQVRVVIFQAFIGQCEMMRTRFGRNFHSAFFGGTHQLDRPRRRQVLTMNLPIGDLGQQDVAGDDDFLGHGRPPAQAKRSAPVTFVHHAVGGDIVILAVIHHRQVEHLCVLDGAAH